MKRKLVFLVIFTLLLTTVSGLVLTSTTAQAAPMFSKVAFTNAVVTVPVLNVREGPGQQFKVVCMVKKGQTVKVFGKIGGWYAVYVVNNGCIGAADSRYIKAMGAVPKITGLPKAKTKTPMATPKPKPKPTTKPPAGTPQQPATGITADEQELLNLVNKARADAGLGALKFDMELVKCARAKAKDMVDKNYFSHQSPTYGSPFDMMKQFGVSFKTAGENIAGNQTVAGAFKAWMNSEGHRKNILNGSFNYVGFGIVPSPTYGKVLVQQFIGR